MPLTADCRAGRARALPACLAATLAIAGCGAGDDDPAPGAVTVGEARALDEAAAMIDERRASDEATASPAPAPATPASAD